MNRLIQAKQISEQIDRGLALIKMCQESSTLSKRVENAAQTAQKRIESIKSKLENLSYTIAFIGLLKSGKSTLANALIGERVLPSENAPCTLGVVNITNQSLDRPSVLLEHRENSNPIVLGQGRDIHNVLLNRIRELRESSDTSANHWEILTQIQALKELDLSVQLLEQQSSTSS